jgi:adenosine deaminase
MRDRDRAMETAQLAVRYRDAGVAGFDLAGPEAGFPARRHAAAFDHVHRAGLPATAHAGEGAGTESIWEAVSWCHAERIGHGVRLADDVRPGAGGEPRLGRLATYVRDRRLALELCPTSNVHTGAVAELGQHPVDLLLELGFRATVNTDNRLMSGVSLSSELSSCARTFGWGWDVLHHLAVNAVKGSFAGYDERRRLLRDVVGPGYEALARAGAGG